MVKRRPPDESLEAGADRLPPDLEAEHQALKEQTAGLVREHQRLHREGGTMAQHVEHRRKLRDKIAELERHADRLKQVRKRP
jgi:hypothetical protein